MKIILVCWMILSTAFIARAQSGTANLTITLTDVQSVKFISRLNEEAPSSTRVSIAEANLELFNRATAQVKTIHSRTQESNLLYAKLFAKPSSERIDPRLLFTFSTWPSSPNEVHIVYQIDPR